MANQKETGADENMKHDATCSSRLRHDGPCNCSARRCSCYDKPKRPTQRIGSWEYLSSEDEGAHFAIYRSSRNDYVVYVGESREDIQTGHGQHDGRFTNWLDALWHVRARINALQSSSDKGAGRRYRDCATRRSPRTLPHIKNQRPDGFSVREHNDCAVLALSALLCVPYDHAHALLADCGRKPRRGTYTRQVEDAIKLAGMRSTYLLPGRDLKNGDYSGPAITAQRVRDYLPARGHFYVSAGHHAFAVIDGVIYDNGAARPRARVECVLRLDLERS